jgi:hypothetical protein
MAPALYPATAWRQDQKYVTMAIAQYPATISPILHQDQKYVTMAMAQYPATISTLLHQDQEDLEHTLPRDQEASDQKDSTTTMVPYSAME